jgi:CheY-like chemotaxis protein/anti-sigma regulatory factor (Ser/Thr protein kinase)
LTFPIDHLLKDLQGQFQQAAREKRISLNRVPCSTLVYSDPALIRIILQNLVSNAIKYTEHGKVLLGCRRRGDLLRICVCDSGIGISQDGQQIIFEEFFQLDNPARDRKQGSGFGLSTVQRVADLLNHPLHVQSVPGKGSCFTLDIPVSEKQIFAEPDKADATSSGDSTTASTLLLIDDDEIVLHANSLLLKTQGYHVVAASGSEAAFDALATGLQADVIISDYRLPGAYTGTELITELRTRTDRLTPSLILTGDITLSDDNAGLPDRCQLVQKPVLPQKLKQIIDQILEEAT